MPANIACIGAEKTPLDNKNNAAQQKMMGVVINTLYGLSLTFTLEKGSTPLQFGFPDPENNHAQYRNLRQIHYFKVQYEIPTPSSNTSKKY